MPTGIDFSFLVFLFFFIPALHQLHFKCNLEIADAHFQQFCSGGLSLLYDVHADSAFEEQS